MKPILALISSFAAILALSGCLGTASLPPNSLTSGHLSLTVGPFFSQSLTVGQVSKDAAGKVVVGSWQGSTSYLGCLTFTQNFSGLEITPSTPAPK